MGSPREGEWFGAGRCAEIPFAANILASVRGGATKIAKIGVVCAQSWWGQVLTRLRQTAQAAAK
jgi:hypothetical protein